MRDLIELIGSEQKRRTALVDAETGESWSYAELDEEVGEEAGKLANEFEAGDHLAALLSYVPEFVKLFHASMRLGAVLVPLDPRLKGDDLLRRCEVADVSGLVFESETEDRVPELQDSVRSVVSLDETGTEGAKALEDVPVADFQAPDWRPDETSTLLFTSGTTGEPKAVELSPRNHVASAEATAQRLGLEPGDRWLDPLPMHHAGGLAPLIRTSLYGTALVVSGKFDAEKLLEQTTEYGATCVSLVPTMLTRLIDADSSPLRDLRFVLLGGASASDELVERCRDEGIPVCPTYGTTETASGIATALPHEAFENVGTVGLPLSSVEVSIVGDDGREVEEGKTGQILASGPVVSKGYYGEDDGSLGEGKFSTGDLGRLDGEGRLWVTGREKDVIVTGGENVHPAEVEGVLKRHRDIDQAAVVGLKDRKWGEAVSALVVPVSRKLDEGPLRSFCGGRLAGFKVPKRIETVDELPRTASGTVDREEVRMILRERR